MTTPSRGALAFLKRHPVVCLLLLSLGIPEYISGSSPMNAIILNPFMFLFQILADIGLYGPGVLLVREAMVRWKKGWATVLLLGAAYGILEEGLALSTLFNPLASPVGQLGFYGHWLGVNWIWFAGIVPVHMVFSISLPILLLGLVAPQTRGKSLLSSHRELFIASFVLAVDVLVLFLFVSKGSGGFWMGWPVFFSSVITVAALVLLARRLSPDALHASSELPKIGSKKSFLIGAFFYAAAIIVEFVFGIGAHLPVAVDFVLVVAVQGAFLMAVLHYFGSRDNERILIAFAGGLVVPIEFFGLVSEIALPLTVLPDLAYAFFLRMLWKQYPAVPVTQIPLAGSSASPSPPSLPGAPSSPPTRHEALRPWQMPDMR